MASLSACILTRTLCPQRHASATKRIVSYPSVKYFRPTPLQYLFRWYTSAAQATQPTDTLYERRSAYETFDKVNRPIPSNAAFNPNPASTPTRAHPPTHIHTQTDDLAVIAHLSDIPASAAAAAAEKGEDITLSEEQEQLLDLLMSGENVFYTGRAGTGKTVLLREFVKRAREAGKNVAVTSATGIAASHIGGQTLHSFMSLRPEHTTEDTKTTETTWAEKARKESEFYRYISMFPARHLPYSETDILVIDEVSMVTPEVLGLLENTAYMVRRKAKKFPTRGIGRLTDAEFLEERNTYRFGGMQVVMTGDFYQLPPVVSRPTDYKLLNEINKMAPSENLGCGVPMSLKAPEKLPDALVEAETETTWEALPDPANPQKKRYRRRVQYLFESVTWRQLRTHGKLRIVELQTVFRQKEPEFVELLDKIRLGVYDESVERRLRPCCGREWADEAQFVRILSCWSTFAYLPFWRLADGVS
ncbi:P-loop containing nucleoside triphosphate hydrolase protein [Fimicolochytrium jonesii]|uniref:P-loop containing nucleoside triphosphate hydrolase protein n=1 Tax=Fimicolochytrium jonesii TaxID=1396493 RepID=UPI0022FDDE18|nr:P-loop containing nucleoside triphosphate hydrolase protein [Fimicolochytrium jonesii]KAI8817051.1 P-loop containing nucleoside triphosphate hydrolase protein [Fimicolochytrium jonesii]